MIANIIWATEISIADEEIVVIAHPLSGAGLSQATVVLTGEELEKKRATNLGATLAGEPGIHSTQFGNAVGRPIIHGLGGARVKIMEDRIDALDLSVTSGDHAVSIEPFIVERIEVLKGASRLLYGSGAIGGVIDVHTARIPHEVPEETNGGLEIRWDANTRGTTMNTILNGGANSFAWHVDSTLKSGNDYKIPGVAESRQLRELQAEGEEPEDEHGEIAGVLPGSQFDSFSAAAGISIVGDWGFWGGAVSTMASEYGLPGGHEHHDEDDHDGGEHSPFPDSFDETATLKLDQTRFDIELGVMDPFESFSSFNTRIGFNDYEHVEREPNGEIATTFTNEAWEARAELGYEGESSGTLGMQYGFRKFSALGVEALVPPINTNEIGLFWVGERPFDSFEIEVGARLGRVAHDPKTTSIDVDFTTYAVSIGLVIPISEVLDVGILADVSGRAPIAEELFSDGPHLVSNSYAIGDQTLGLERASSISGTVEYDAERWRLSVTSYITRFDDFILQRFDGTTRDGLPKVVFTQRDTKFAGIDMETEFRLDVSDWQLGIRFLLDAVNAEIDEDGGRKIPRLPPSRYGFGIDLVRGAFAASLDYVHTHKQRKVADLELPTDDYGDLRVDVSWIFDLTSGTTLQAFVQGRNLTDAEQRFHTSFVKDVAPAPGRSVTVGLELEF